MAAPTAEAVISIFFIWFSFTSAIHIPFMQRPRFSAGPSNQQNYYSSVFVFTLPFSILVFVFLPSLVFVLIFSLPSSIFWPELFTSVLLEVCIELLLLSVFISWLLDAGIFPNAELLESSL